MNKEVRGLRNIESFVSLNKIVDKDNKKNHWWVNNQKDYNRTNSNSFSPISDYTNKEKKDEKIVLNYFSSELSEIGSIGGSRVDTSLLNVNMKLSHFLYYNIKPQLDNTEPSEWSDMIVNEGQNVSLKDIFISEIYNLGMKSFQNPKRFKMGDDKSDRWSKLINQIFINDGYGVEYSICRDDMFYDWRTKEIEYFDMLEKHTKSGGKNKDYRLENGVPPNSLRNPHLTTEQNKVINNYKIELLNYFGYQYGNKSSGLNTDVWSNDWCGFNGRWGNDLKVWSNILDLYDFKSDGIYRDGKNCVDSDEYIGLIDELINRKVITNERIPFFSFKVCYEFDFSNLDTEGGNMDEVRRFLNFHSEMTSNTKLQHPIIPIDRGEYCDTKTSNIQSWLPITNYLSSLSEVQNREDITEDFFEGLPYSKHTNDYGTVREVLRGEITDKHSWGDSYYRGYTDWDGKDKWDDKYTDGWDRTIVESIEKKYKNDYDEIRNERSNIQCKLLNLKKEFIEKQKELMMELNVKKGNLIVEENKFNETIDYITDFFDEDILWRGKDLLKSNETMDYGYKGVEVGTDVLEDINYDEVDEMFDDNFTPLFDGDEEDEPKVENNNKEKPQFRRIGGLN